MKKISLAFLGNSNISISALKSLNESNLFDVKLVITNCDKPSGRKMILQPTPVKRYSLENDLKVFETNSINKDLIKLVDLDVDYFLTCSFGQLLSQDVLSFPNKKTLNVHTSLLPRGRGGAPVHRAILSNEDVTGVTYMETVLAMDAGPYYSQHKINILKDDTYDTLLEKLSLLIEETIVASIVDIDSGKLTPMIQNEDEITFSKNIKKEETFIDFNESCLNVYNKIRGLYHIPNARIMINGNIIKVNKSHILNEEFIDEGKIGEILKVNQKGVFVKCSDGIVVIENITLPGKNPSSISELINGSIPLKKGMIINHGKK